MRQREGGDPRRPGGPGRPVPRSRSGRPRRGEPAAVPVRSRLTGRAAVLVLVVVALLVSYASSVRAYVDQRSHIESLEASIASSQSAIEELRRERRRWQDPAYVEAQARARFSFGYPGEVGYHVLDEDGRPLDAQSVLPESAEVGDGRPEWWESTLSSIEAAGRPLEPQRAPLDLIRAPVTRPAADR